MAISDISGVSNATLWDMARKEDPNFASHTAKATADTFTQKGFEGITRNGISTLNEWFSVSMRIAFQMLNVAGARNPLADSGLVEVYDTPNGGFVQRMALDAIKPISPKYKGLTDRGTVDPFTIRKPTLTERFYQHNFDFQNLVTHQDFQVKEIFISEYGMGQLLAGIIQGLQASYVKQDYYNTLECLNVALNSTTTPLQDSQVVRLSSWTSTSPTTAELTEFIKIGKNIARSMRAVASTSLYNAAGFDDIASPDDYIMLIRPSIATDIETMNALNAPGSVSIPFAVREVENFGGMIPYVSTTRVYPVYDSLGVEIGYSATQGSSTATYHDSDITSWDDPNKEILAVIAQKGVIFENAQNPFSVETIRNPAGLYDNYWASRPGTAIVYDAYRGLITICAPKAAKAKSK